MELDEPERLPSLNGHRNKLNNLSGVSENKSMLPPILGNQLRGEKENNGKMKEISRAYKVNMSHVDELKEKYRVMKR
jgi:hypothetical protein